MSLCESWMVLGCVAAATVGLMGAIPGAISPASAAEPRYWQSGEENLHSPQHIYHEAGTDRVLKLAYSTPNQGDTKAGAKTYKMWYQVSEDGGRTYDKLRRIIQQGEQFDAEHPIAPVWIGKNSYVASIPPPSRASNGEIMVPIYFWPLDEQGELAHVDDTFTYTAVGVLIGRWVETSDRGLDMVWDLGQTVHLDFATESTRGAMEPAIIELSEPGHFLMIMRASNYKKPSMPSYKWKAVSTDYCRTWSEPTPFTYADGEPFFSPSACSVIMRSSKNGKIYWFGNICPENADANYPRYPLVVGVVDEETLGLVRDSVRVIDTRDPAKGDTEKVQFSNFKVTEDPETGAFIVTLTRLDAGRRKKGLATPWAGVDWPKERYVVEVED